MLSTRRQRTNEEQAKPYKLKNTDSRLHSNLMTTSMQFGPKEIDLYQNARIRSSVDLYSSSDLDRSLLEISSFPLFSPSNLTHPQYTPRVLSIRLSFSKMPSTRYRLSAYLGYCMRPVVYQGEQIKFRSTIRPFFPGNSSSPINLIKNRLSREKKFNSQEDHIVND